MERNTTSKEYIEINDRGFKILVKTSELRKAEYMLKSGRIKKVKLKPKENAGSFFTDCYFEQTKLPDKKGEFQYRYSLWPTVFGYYGSIDGYIQYTNKLLSMEDFIKNIGFEIDD